MAVAGTTSGAYLGIQSGVTGTVTVDGTGSAWTNGNQLYVGWSGVATMNIINGGTMSSGSSYVGCGAGQLTVPGSGSTGTVTVSGAGSTWNNRNLLYVGYFETGGAEYHERGGGQQLVRLSRLQLFRLRWRAAGTVTVDGFGSTWNSGGLTVGYIGTGTLNISNGGTVVVAGTTYASTTSRGTGTINFGANGGTLTTGSLNVLPSQVTGTGTINACGLVSGGNVVFDATHALNQTFTWNGVGQDVTVNLDLTGTRGAVGDLGAGYEGIGSLTIQGGVAVASANGYLGYMAGSAGTGTVSGPGSTWTIGASGPSISAITAPVS